MIPYTSMNYPNHNLHTILLQKKSTDELRKLANKSKRKGFWTQEEIDLAERNLGTILPVPLRSRLLGWGSSNNPITDSITDLDGHIIFYERFDYGNRKILEKERYRA